MLLQQSIQTGLPQKKKDQLMIFGIAVLYLLQLLVDHPPLWAFVGVGAGYIIARDLPFFKQRQRMMWLILAVLTSVALLNFLAHPSEAVLLTRVQNFFTRSFSTSSTEGNTTNLINLVCNGLRSAYILCIVIAGWNGWQDFQQNQEMGSFARNMLFSLAVIFSMDVISALIVPAA